MSDVNKAILIGNLGKDPEVRYTPSGQAVANFTIATNESWTDKEGQKQERVEWHRIVVWGKLAENCGEYLTKGKQVYVEGKVQTREWTNKEGAKQFTTEIVAQFVKFLGDRDKTTTAKKSSSDKQQSRSQQGGASDDDFGSAPPPKSDDDIPF